MFRVCSRSIAEFARRLRHSTRGGVALIGALSLTSVVGMGAFAVEATQGYAAKTSNQRIADMAALAGALAYNVHNSTTEMTATAKAVAAAQGLPASAAAVALVTDAATSQQLVEVTVTTSVPITLGRVLTPALSYEVSAIGAATLSTTATITPPCVAALSGTPTYGVDLNGGTSISASGCAVSTNAGVSVGGGASITTQQVNAGKSVDTNGGATITTTPTANNIFQNKTNAASDWMISDAGLKAALCQVNKINNTTDADYADGNDDCISELVTPAAASGPDWNLDYSPTGEVAAYRSGSTYVIPVTSTRVIRSVTLAGGITATFQGPANLTIGTITMGGGTTLHIGGGNVVINNKIDLQGGAVLDIDVGVGNSVTIGSSTGTTSGTSISIAGGSKVCFTANCAAPTAAAGKFSVAGEINSNGGSTIIFPKAETHIIGGDLDLQGSSTFGSGTYIIGGSFTNNTGGTMTGSDVSFVLGGTFTLSGGTSLDLAAPGASSYGLPGILAATKSSADTKIGGGSANQYAGLIYAPKSDLTISGGGAISTHGSACLMMIVNTLTLKGGGSASTGTCSNLSTTGATERVALFR